MNLNGVLKRRGFAALVMAGTAFCGLIPITASAQGAPGRCAGVKYCDTKLPAPAAVDPGLPAYTPSAKLSGKIRIYGSPLGGQVEAWVAAFKTYHPDLVVETSFPSSDAAVASLLTNTADIAVGGRELTLVEYLAFFEVHQYNLIQIAVASGTYNVRGRTPSVVIYVNKDNPLTKLTMEQLDGVFGSERTGGYDGFVWRPENGRGPDKDIRTWGQLGLKGEWANKPIRTHGYAFTGMTNYFQAVVFKGGDKWNPNYKQYVESFTKMVPNGDYGPGSSQYMLEQVVKDKYAIAWSFIPQQERMKSGEVKALEIGTSPSGPFYAPNLENTLSRKYPLTRSVFFYIKKPAGGADPNVLEFMRFVESREGQAAVSKLGVYLPLPSKMANQELAKLK